MLGVQQGKTRQDTWAPAQSRNAAGGRSYRLFLFQGNESGRCAVRRWRMMDCARVIAWANGGGDIECANGGSVHCVHDEKYNANISSEMDEKWMRRNYE